MSAKDRKKIRAKKKALYVMQGGKCAYCGNHVPRAAATLDHVVPRALGGNNAMENLKVACWHCNQAKADKPPHVFHALLMQGLVA